MRETEIFRKAGALKWIFGFITSGGIALVVYYSGLEVMRSQVGSQETKIQKIEDRVSNDHDIIVEIRTEQRATRSDIAEIKRMLRNTK